ncbi:hypothetical protein SLEP1_g57189, partial [Rubroshorea leprosula]
LLLPSSFPLILVRMRKSDFRFYLLLPFHSGQLQSLFSSTIFLQFQFPLFSRLNDAYSELPPFQDAMPEKQPDAPPHH